MPASAKQLLAELPGLESNDPVVAAVAARVRPMVADLAKVHGVPDLKIFFADVGSGSEALRASDLNTPSFMCVIEPPTIVASASFLLALETVVRAFGLSDALLDSQYLRSDEQMYGLIRRLRHAPDAYLQQLRLLESEKRKDDRAYVLETLTLTAFFFASHEIGHLLTGSGGNYATYLKAEDKLERRIAYAVFKLCRHVEQLNEHDFGLPGFTDLAEPASTARRAASRLSASLEPSFRDATTAYFADEAEADRLAEKSVVTYLQRLGDKNPFLADQHRYILFRGLFATALYSWYSDLLTFAQTLGVDGAPDNRELMFLMMQDRKRYISVASLFGDIHGYTLLRTHLAMRAVIQGTTDFFEKPKDQRRIRWTKPADPDPKTRWWDRILAWDPKRQSDRAALQTWWLSECLQRYVLLNILMDTASKFAHVGCATGWILDADERRGSPQVFLMNFYSLRDEMQRLRGFA